MTPLRVALIAEDYYPQVACPSTCIISPGSWTPSAIMRRS